jgi:hypothetical protein
MKPLLFLIICCLIACKPAVKEMNAQQIIDKAILASGAYKVANSKISFKFRDKKYRAIRKKGSFELIKIYTSTDSLKIVEILSNNKYQRTVNSKTIRVSDSLAKIASNSVNSVHYFSVLPFGLNDQAVQKKLLAPTVIEGKEYFKVQITFLENSGGEDFEDVFIYWIDCKDFLINYMAYSYHTNIGGKRFRVLKDASTIGGIRFIDFDNFKPKDRSVPLENIDDAFKNKKLIKVSEIILKDITVEF